jgi:hypothetical protein
VNRWDENQRTQGGANAVVYGLPGVKIVDLTHIQRDLLPRLAIDHLQLERLDLLFEILDRLDRLASAVLHMSRANSSLIARSRKQSTSSSPAGMPFSTSYSFSFANFAPMPLISRVLPSFSSSATAPLPRRV